MMTIPDWQKDYEAWLRIQRNSEKLDRLLDAIREEQNTTMELATRWYEQHTLKIVKQTEKIQQQMEQGLSVLQLQTDQIQQQAEQALPMLQQQAETLKQHAELLLNQPYPFGQGMPEWL